MFSLPSSLSFLSNTKSRTHKIESLPPYLIRPPPLHHRKVAAATPSRCHGFVSSSLPPRCRRAWSADNLPSSSWSDLPHKPRRHAAAEPPPSRSDFRLIDD
ncbi:hypothetical protein LINPERPRIM_LOCUS37306 [Linum perenne]